MSAHGRDKHNSGQKKRHTIDQRTSELQAQGVDMVSLQEMPMHTGPLMLDTEGRRAIPAPLAQDERLAKLELPPETLAALVALLAPKATDEQRSWGGQILDKALGLIEPVRDK